MVSIPESLVQRPENRDEMIAFFARNGFKSWLRELSAEAAAGNGGGAGGTPETGSGQAGLFAEEKPPIETHYETVLTEARLDAWLATIDTAAVTSVDTETTSLDPLQAQLVGVSLCCVPGTAAYIPVAHTYQDAPVQLTRDYVLAKLKPWLENPSKPKLGQHLKYDSHIFANHGVNLRGIVNLLRSGRDITRDRLRGRGRRRYIATASGDVAQHRRRSKADFHL